MLSSDINIIQRLVAKGLPDRSAGVIQAAIEADKGKMYSAGNFLELVCDSCQGEFEVDDSALEEEIQSW